MKVLWFAGLLLVASGCATPTYLARVNGDEIRGEEALLVFGRQHVALEKALADEKDIRKLLDKVVDRRLMLQEAQRLGLQDAPDVRDAADRYEGDLLVALLRKREVDEKATTTDADVAAAHALLDRVFVVRQLVVRSRAAAEALRARAAAGEDLETLVRAQSIGPASRRGGNLMVQWGGDDQAREKVVLGLSEAELSPVFRSNDGWEFVRMERRVEAKLPELAAVRSEVERVLRRRALEGREAALRDELWGKYEAKVTPCPPPAEGAGAVEPAPQLCATWTGGALTAADVAAAVDRTTIADAPADVAAEVVEKRVRELALRELMVAEGRARGWAELPEIATKVAFMRENLAEEKLYSEHVFRDLTVTDEEVRAYHDAKPDEFMRPEMFELAHIAVAGAEAAEDIVQALAAGAVFEDLAAERSLDKPSAARGGYVGSFTPEQLKPPLDKVLPLEVGATTEPFQLGDGHHVVKLVRKHPERRLSYEEAAPEAKEKLLRERATERYERWVGTLRRAGNVKMSARGIRAFSAERLAAVRKEEEEKRRITAQRAEVAAAAKAAAAKDGDATGEAEEGEAGTAVSQPPPEQPPAPAPVPKSGSPE